MKTYLANSENVKRGWWLIDLEGQTLGRAATQIARVLRGKHKAEFTPHADAGDFIVAINASKIKLSGNKWEDKKYFTHNYVFGSLKEVSAKEKLKKDPSEIVELAVEGMLPKNKMRKKIIRKLKVYNDGDHPHKAQKLETFKLA